MANLDKEELLEMTGQVFDLLSASLDLTLERRIPGKIAKILYEYFRRLQDAGFNREEALQITVSLARNQTGVNAKTS